MMDRRTFLAGFSGATAWATIPAPLRALPTFPTIPDRPDATAVAAASWIAHRDGRFVLSLPRAELGQNVSTGLKRIACAELGVGWDDVQVSLADTATIAPFRATVGSESIQDFALPLAWACAALREAVAAGGKGRIEVQERSASELRAFRDGALPKAPHLDGGLDIVTGAPLFAADVRLEGMIVGRVLRSGVSPEIGSRPKVWNAKAAKAERGFVALVEGDELDLNESRGLGILAKTPGGLDRIEAALAVEWEVDETPPDDEADTLVDIDRQIEAGGPSYDLKDNRLDTRQRWDVDIRIDTPLAAHAPIEPRAAVADMTGAVGRVWVGSQDPFYVRDTLTDRLGLDEDEVVVIPTRVGGGFGGKAVPLVEIEAAALSRAIDLPVKVQWSRGQELALAYHRPPTSHRVQAMVSGGRITGWRHRMSSGHVIFSSAVLPSWMQTLTDFIGDDGAARNLSPPYEFSRAVIGYDLERLPIRTGAWRGLGAGPNTLAIEVAMDRCARSAGRSPLAFRLAHVVNPRLRAVLEAVAEIAGPEPDAGRGIGCGIYKGVSYGAVIADMGRPPDGAPCVKRMFAAHDCGKIIDADQVRAQCEGNMMWSIGMVLSDRLTVRKGAIAERDFADAPVPTIVDAPPMEVRLLETANDPVGAGETLMASAPGALANGLASLIGTAPARLPVARSA